MNSDIYLTAKKSLYTFSTLLYLTEATSSNSLAQTLIHKNMDFRAALKTIKEAQRHLKKAEEQCQKYINLETGKELQ